MMSVIAMFQQLLSHSSRFRAVRELGMEKPEPVVTRIIDKRIVDAKCSACNEPLDMADEVKSTGEQELALEVAFDRHLQEKHRDCFYTPDARH
jgi:hypothetical protein